MKRLVVGLSVAAIFLTGACGGDSPESTPASGDGSAWSQGAVPTAAQLASVLVTEDDYDGEWTVNVPPDSQMETPGVVPESQRQLLPTIDLCDEAGEESQAAADSLRWQAFRQLDQSEEDPIDMALGDRVGHLIFVQEFLMSGDSAEMQATFGALRDGMVVCQGEFPAGEEGPGTTEPIVVPEVGDDVYADLTTMEEAGGGAYWLIYNTWVRQGPVLMDLQVVDIVMGEGVDPVITTEDVGTFVTTAVERLP